jgi:hypothetical protein
MPVSRLALLDPDRRMWVIGEASPFADSEIMGDCEHRLGFSSASVRAPPRNRPDGAARATGVHQRHALQDQPDDVEHRQPLRNTLSWVSRASRPKSRSRSVDVALRSVAVHLRASAATTGARITEGDRGRSARSRAAMRRYRVFGEDRDGKRFSVVDAAVPRRQPAGGASRNSIDQRAKFGARVLVAS